jgi:uncharacterized protein
MPVTPTYPGVYIEEIPSGVRTIVGVATSITAFIGRAQRGPTNEPVAINSYADFERQFGGLSRIYPMSFTVRDFYLNGGSQAIIVRTTNPNSTEDKKPYGAAMSVVNAVMGAADMPAAKAQAEAAHKIINDDANKTAEEKAAAKMVVDAVNNALGQPNATLEQIKDAAKAAAPPSPASKAKLALKTKSGALILEAASEGKWGNALGAEVDYNRISSDIAERYKPLTADQLFNIAIRDLNSGAAERFLCVTIVPNHPRSIDLVLKHSSSLVRVSGALPSTRPDETDAAIKTALEAIKAAGEVNGAKDDAKKQGKDAAEKLKLIEQPFNPNQDWRYATVAEADRGADGGNLTARDIVSGPGLQDNKQGLYALDKASLFNLLCIPPDKVEGTVGEDIFQMAMKYCVDHRAMLIVDPPTEWAANRDTAAADAQKGLDNLGLSGIEARNAAIFFPRVIQSDPTMDGQLDTFAPCGIVAGVMARTDAQRGVWKAPAGLDAAISGVRGLQVNLNDAENGMLNPLGINCLRAFPAYGQVVWGSRTLRGADQLADEYKYVPVRRLALFIEESLYRGLKWVVFEPNAEPLWAQIRLNVGAFMHDLLRKGAFQGTTPHDAYFVKCDKETTTQNDINLGIVKILVGFAPLKPAEFVIIKLQQMAGQIEV